MKRVLVLGTVIVVGGLSAVVNSEQQLSQAALDATVIEHVRDNLYVITGSSPLDRSAFSGGNTGVYIGAEGITLVDTKLPGWGQALMDRIRTVSDKPVTTIINTHTHYDHSGGNVEFSDSVNIVVHENTAAQMSRETCEPVTNCDAFKGENAVYLPKTTFSDRMTLFDGPDAVDLYYFGRGHTDGDTWIVFRNARTLHTGDMFARKGLPFLDVVNGNGSALEFGETLRKAVAGIPDVDIIIPGHNDETLVWDDLANYSTFYNGIVDAAKAGQAAGQSVEDVVGSYAVPIELRDFNAEPGRLHSVVQYVFDGQ